MKARSCKEMERDDTKKLAEMNKDKQCFNYKKKGHVKSDCRHNQRGMKQAKDSGDFFVDRKHSAATTDDEITGAVIDIIPNMASNSFVFA